MSKMAEYEKYIEELEQIMQKMSREDVGLEESVGLYARAAELIKTCADCLNEAQVQIQEIDDKISEMGLNGSDGL